MCVLSESLIVSVSSDVGGVCMSVCGMLFLIAIATPPDACMAGLSFRYIV